MWHYCCCCTGEQCSALDNGLVSSPRKLFMFRRQITYFQDQCIPKRCIVTLFIFENKMTAGEWVFPRPSCNPHALPPGWRATYWRSPSSSWRAASSAANRALTTRGIATCKVVPEPPIVYSMAVLFQPCWEEIWYFRHFTWKLCVWVTFDIMNHDITNRPYPIRQTCTIQTVFVLPKRSLHRSLAVKIWEIVTKVDFCIGHSRHCSGVSSHVRPKNQKHLQIATRLGIEVDWQAH